MLLLSLRLDVLSHTTAAAAAAAAVRMLRCAMCHQSLRTTTLTFFPPKKYRLPGGTHLSLQDGYTSLELSISRRKTRPTGGQATSQTSKEEEQGAPLLLQVRCSLCGADAMAGAGGCCSLLLLCVFLWRHFQVIQGKRNLHGRVLLSYGAICFYVL